MSLMRISVRHGDTQSRTQSTALDGVRYRLSFYYNKPADFWTLDIADSTDTALVSGLRLTLGVDLLEPFKYKIGFPQGQLFVYDTSRTDTEPGRDDFDERCLLFYRPAAEVVA